MREVISLNGKSSQNAPPHLLLPLHSNNILTSNAHSGPSWLPNRQFLLGGEHYIALWDVRTNRGAFCRIGSRTRLTSRDSSTAWSTASRCVLTFGMPLRIAHSRGGGFTDAFAVLSPMDTSQKSAKPPTPTRVLAPSSRRLV